MPKVTTIPTTLLRQDNGLVEEGDTLTFGGVTNRRVRLCSVVPDNDGLVTVQETFRVPPEQVGLHLREETVILELNRAEATAVLDFYNKTRARGSAVDPQAGEVLDALQSNAGGRL
jgi:hypothetical protein